MSFNLKPYRKFIVTLIIPVVAFGLKYFGIDIEFGEEQASSLINILTPVLYSLGVWGVANQT